ncbi:hypothetical protein [Thalassomonas haliotis]|uniref:Lipoprotein n=1 Tax=Thalassomonas haliotis TaxID=485448 RepID=A0ABY7VHZ2_9GAMM|nr:hypothetical protein [Thalassomonas haliotis]WDE12655.1 hypothetical protein H3N35_04045 [Thalassomonas haliotis]
MSKITKKMVLGFVCAAFATVVFAATCTNCYSDRQGGWLCEKCVKGPDD